MYAVVKTGGKQYRITEGDTLRVEKLPGEVGTTVEFPEVIAVGEGTDVKVGTPTVEGARVLAEIVEQGKDKKIIIFKKKRRKGYSRKQGHRQSFTGVRIKEIKA
ncbi:MAG TPA: 50S ribosomal protein L21 [Thermodesulfobacteriota bacterium]|nr:50S ribosomal protein L21 [Thermodesulfobacteriota bacterium]